MKKIGIESIREAQALHKQSGVQAASALLEQYVQEIQAAQNTQYITSEQEQYFCFTTTLDNLIYKASERDPRIIHVLEDSFDKVYAYLAACYKEMGQLDAAAQAMAQAVRWNPVRCEYRLQLAELSKQQGDLSSALSLAHSVFARSVYPEEHLEAYLFFIEFFLQQQQLSTAAALVYVASLYRCPSEKLDEFSRVLIQAGSDPYALDEELVEQLLDAQDIPDGPSIELMISLLVYADECLKAGEDTQAQDYRAIVERFLGEKKTADLAAIIREEA